MSILRYPVYRDSGIGWLGEVPGHWELKRLRFVAEFNPSKSEMGDMNRDKEVSFLPMDNIGDNGILKLDRTRPISEVSSGYTYFREGDVAVAKITPCFENGKGAIMHGLVGGIGFGTTELIVARPIQTETTSNYLYWLFMSAPFRKMGEASMYGAGGQKRVPDDFVRDFVIAIPPLSEQVAITTYIEHEVKKMDTLVIEQERLIEILKEKRQVIISQAVTKGLDPTVPMKDYGIEWLGEIPEHWEIIPFKYVISSIETGTSVNAVDTPAEDGEVGVLKVSCVYSGQFIARENKVVVQDELHRVTCSPRVNRLIVSRANTPDLVGAAGLVREETEGLFLSDKLWQLSFFDQIEPAFVHYWTMTHAYRGQVKLACSGASTSMQNLSQNQFCRFIFPKPMLEEQKAVVSFLDQETYKIDELVADAVRAIDLLKERRSALISAAVTGKIDVRGLVAEEVTV